MALDFSTLIQALAGNPISGEGGTAPTGVDPISVQAPSRSPSTTAPVDHSIYNNLPEVQTAQTVQGQYPQHHGAFGVKGTLRDVLGTIGDAFMMAHGEQPYYRNRVQQEKEADAMTGFQADPRAAAGRLAAIPGAADMAEKMYNAYNTEELKKSQQDNLMNYRNDTTIDRYNREADRVAQSLTQIGGGVLNDPSIKTPEDYAAAYGRVQKLITARGKAKGAYDSDSKSRADIEMDDLGFVPPELWKPGMNTQGMSGAQVDRNVTQNRSITQRGQIADQTSDDRRYAVDHRPQPQPRVPTVASMLADVKTKMDNNQPLTQAEQDLWTANVTNKGKPKSVVMPPSLQTGGNGNSTPPKSGGGKMVIRGGKLVQQ